MTILSPVSPLASYDMRTFSSPNNNGTTRYERRYPKPSSEQQYKGPESKKDGLEIQMKEFRSPTSPENVYNPRALPPIDSNQPRPSLARSTSTPSSSYSHKKTDSITERLILQRSTKAAQWTIHWRAPLTTVSAFVVGLILAIGQHMLYSKLHHESLGGEDNKTKKVLYGRALAYFSKIAFGGCVTMVYRQRLWTTLRHHALSIWSIDQLFLGTEDPTLFFNWETLTKALLPTILALIIWLVPLATIIFSPGALTFGEFREIDVTSLAVPTLNFTAESTTDWRIPIKLDDNSHKKSVMFYNTTDRLGKKDGWFDYYDQPSSDLTRISVLNAWSVGNQSTMRTDARQKSCGGEQFNCTYTNSFIAPQYKCEEVATGPQDDQKLFEMGAPFNTSELVPYGKHVYLSNVDVGEYSRPQAPNISNDGGVPLGRIPDELGTFMIEPHLWIGYSTNSTEPWPPNSPFAQNWTSRLDAHIVRCIHYEAQYTVSWNYTEPYYTIDSSWTFLEPIIDTNFSKLENGKPDYLTIKPASNFVSPRTDVGKYKKIAAYHAVGESMRDFLRGNIELEPEFPGNSYPRVNSKITQTRLVSKTNSTPYDHFEKHLQDFYSDTVLSLFSAPGMLVIAQENTTVTRSRFRATFIYEPETLWACYAPVIIVTFLILLLYAFTLWQDGTTWSIGFSRILVTTRNQTLDEISRGACLGNNPFPSELLRTKLQFGVLNEPTDFEVVGLDGFTEVGHCSFGVPSELSPIIKGAPYAGLTRRRTYGGAGLRPSMAPLQEKEKTD
ncbi:unnamed protein product [Periconia digitata]|uniref:Uncharacterized protein n=1 Tax=Periconia digitata TaxID=1303443 RepID=A0A9W4XIT7_9PLEO|nr:unnamed protein product [Periconia digitata]